MCMSIRSCSKRLTHLSSLSLSLAARLLPACSVARTVNRSSVRGFAVGAELLLTDDDRCTDVSLDSESRHARTASEEQRQMSGAAAAAGSMALALLHAASLLSVLPRFLLLL